MHRAGNSRTKKLVSQVLDSLPEKTMRNVHHRLPTVRHYHVLSRLYRESGRRPFRDVAVFEKAAEALKGIAGED